MTDWTAILTRKHRRILTTAANPGPPMPATEVSAGGRTMNVLTQRIVTEAQARAGQSAPGGGESFAWGCLDAACSALALPNPIGKPSGIVEQAEKLGATADEPGPGFLFGNGVVKQIAPDGRRMQTIEVVGGRVVERWNRHVADHAVYLDPTKLFA